MAVAPPILLVLLSWGPACRGSIPVELATGSSDDSTGTDATAAPAMSSTDADDPGDPTAAETTGTCGDGELQAGEACDDGVNDGAYGGCLPDCSALAGHCGDGRVQADGDEACDDGDAIDGNGCNTDCRPSGMVVWEHQDVRFGAAVDVEVGEDGSIYAAGRADGLVAAGWAARLSDADGTVEWSYELPTPSGALAENMFYTVSAAGEGDLWLGGRHDDVGRLVRLDRDGGPLETLPVPAFTTVRHLAVLPDGDFLVTNGWDAARIDGLVQQWQTPVGVGLAYRSGDETALAAIHTDGAGFRPFSVHGGAFQSVELAMPEGLSVTSGSVAWTADGDVVVAGQVSGASASDALVFESSSSGELRWLYGPRELHQQYRVSSCLAVDSRGAVIVGGYGWLLSDPRPFLMKLSPEGGVLWIRQVEFQAAATQISGCATTPTDEIVVVGHAGSYFWFSKLTP